MNLGKSGNFDQKTRKINKQKFLYSIFENNLSNYKQITCLKLAIEQKKISS